MKMNAFLYGLFLLVFLYQEVSSTKHHTLFCYRCNGVSDPKQCTTMVTCYDASCTTDAYLKDGTLYYDLGCHFGCHALTESPLIGKRSTTDKGTHLCRSCTLDYTEQVKTCRSYMNYQYTTKVTTLPPTTLLPTTRAPTTRAPTTHAPTTHAQTTQAPTTHAPKTTTTTTRAPTTAQPTVAPSTTLAPIEQTTVSDCFDQEKNDFDCTEWKSYGFCEAATGIGHDLAVERCQKTCGFC